MIHRRLTSYPQRSLSTSPLGAVSSEVQPAPNGLETKGLIFTGAAKGSLGYSGVGEARIRPGAALLVSRGLFVASARFCIAIGRVRASNREEVCAFMI
jgi:hypothetical protein